MRTASRPLSSQPRPTSPANARAISVAHAAPATPMAGAGPQPKMRIGSRTTLSTLEKIVRYMGRKVSPAPRRDERKAKKRNVKGTLQMMTVM